jgi:Recombination endonuclease VII
MSRWNTARTKIQICKKCGQLKPHYPSRLSSCKDCQNNYTTANKEKRKAQSRKWRQNNKHVAQKYWSDNKEKLNAMQREFYIKRTYGLTPARFTKIFTSQGNVCACCGSDNPGSKRGWQVDHDHNKNRVRAILCQPCNSTIGHAKESIYRLLACVSYLQAAEDAYDVS